MENYMEEFKLLRETITKNHDSQFITLGFTIASVGSIMGVIVSSEKIKFCDILYLLDFGMFILLASFIIIIRLIYSVRIIGGYISKYLEPKIFNSGEGWESRVSQLDSTSKRTTYLLSKGSHMTFIYLYLFMALAIVLTLITKIEDFNVSILTLSLTNKLLIICISILFLVIVVTAIELNKKAKSWKNVWGDLEKSKASSNPKSESKSS